MLPRKCPTCGGEVTTGFVQAGKEGEELLYWNHSDPQEAIGRPEALQKPPVVRSFHLSSLGPNCAEARRCEKCKVVVFQYVEISR